MDDPGKNTILIVDDDNITHHILGDMLFEVGVEVRQADSGAEALKLARDKPALIILDAKLPDINCFQVCQQIKSDPVVSEIPTLIIDRERKIINCNKALAMLVGKFKTDIIGRPCWHILHETSEPIKECPFESRHRENLIIQRNAHWLEIFSNIIYN